MDTEELKAQLTKTEERLSNIIKSLPEHLTKDWHDWDLAREAANAAVSAREQGDARSAYKNHQAASNGHADAAIDHAKEGSRLIDSANPNGAKEHLQAAIDHLNAERLHDVARRGGIDSTNEAHRATQTALASSGLARRASI